MIAGVIRLVDRPVRAVMTPRREVDKVDLSTDPDDIRRTIAKSIHSRLPVHAGTPEEMLGIVQAKDLLDAYLRGDRPDIRAHMHDVKSVGGIGNVWRPSSTTSTDTSKASLRTQISWKRLSVISEQRKARSNPMPCGATMDRD